MHAKLLGPSSTSEQRHGGAGVEGTIGPGRGAGWRRQGLVGNTQTISTAQLEAAARPAGPGRTTSRRAEQPISTPRATGVEGTGRSKRPGRGAGGRRRGLVGNTQTISTARLEAAARPAGPGRASRRRAELKARSADGERAGRPRGGRRSGSAQNTSGATHNRPGTPHDHPGTPKGRVPKYPPLVGSLSHCLVED